MMCNTFWQAVTFPLAFAASAFETHMPGTAHSGKVAVDDEHREHDALLTMPLWCCLVTRVVKPKSIEAQRAGADAAMKEELHNVNNEKVWNNLSKKLLIIYQQIAK